MSFENDPEAEGYGDHSRMGYSQNKMAQNFPMYLAFGLFILFDFLDDKFLFHERIPNVRNLVGGISLLVASISCIVVIQTKEFYGRYGRFFKGKYVFWVGVTGLFVCLFFAGKLFIEYFTAVWR